jgi:hypothetical protein
LFAYKVGWSSSLRMYNCIHGPYKIVLMEMAGINERCAELIPSSVKEEP